MIRVPRAVLIFLFVLGLIAGFGLGYLAASPELSEIGSAVSE